VLCGEQQSLSGRATNLARLAPRAKLDSTHHPFYNEISRGLMARPGLVFEEAAARAAVRARAAKPRLVFYFSWLYLRRTSRDKPAHPPREHSRLPRPGLRRCRPIIVSPTPA